MQCAKAALMIKVVGQLVLLQLLRHINVQACCHHYFPNFSDIQTTPGGSKHFGFNC